MRVGWTEPGGESVKLAEVLRRWKAQRVLGLAWDHAASHLAKAVGDLSAALLA